MPDSTYDLFTYANYESISQTPADSNPHPESNAPGIPESASNCILLVDGMALLFRAFFATSFTGSFMINSKGIPTNAIHGFVRYFWDAIKTFQPSHVICCWDMGSKTFRTEKFIDYKANRAEAPLELLPQFDLVKEVVTSFGVRNIGLAGYEADDCIGTLSKLYSEHSTVMILSGDHDMLQLVNERTQVIIMKNGFSNYTVYDPATLLEEKGLTAQQVVDIKGLMGDPADNYPGVKGIGEKTALKLIQAYHSIEGILENLHLLPKGIKAKIECELEMLHLSRDLARIRCDVPIECALAECLWKLDPEPVKLKFAELEFRGLIKLIS